LLLIMKTVVPSMLIMAASRVIGVFTSGMPSRRKIATAPFQVSGLRASG
jgi:hypothetical protein